MDIPDAFAQWFAGRGWQLRSFQRQMLVAYANRRSGLLIAPTGGGKTLAGFLPALVDLSRHSVAGLHTLYISPLKALTQDVERNLRQPVEEIGLGISMESRTGDTPSHKRARQRSRPPNILLTTPESLMLMLSYPDAAHLFASLKLVIIDEIHSFAATKRGDLVSLALARLQNHSPQLLRFGLSATVSDPQKFAAWLGKAGKPAQIMTAEASAMPQIHILNASKAIPYGGYMAQYAMPEIYAALAAARSCLIFVNTRAQAELVFQQLWDINRDGLPIALYHGSLDKTQRRKTEAMMAAGKLRAIVATSALELGIDWGNIDLVIQIGAPKGVGRLLQRIGRANHRMDEPSRALLVPANRFEALECFAALQLAAGGKIDGELPGSGALDVVAQYILNCACSAAVVPDVLYAEITSAYAYADLPREIFDALFRFVRDGGYALQAYERYQRLLETPQGYVPASQAIIQRHRQNIGVIIEAARLKVKKLRKAHQGRILGEVEEALAQSMTPGDTFYFAGEVLAFAGIEDMTLEAWPARSDTAKIPSYVGGQMPLSTFLAGEVRELLANPRLWKSLPKEVGEWLMLQQRFSHIPSPQRLLIEHFPYRGVQYSMFYSFEGRKAGQTLGMLLTRRMERMGLKPLHFNVTDYALSIATLEQITQAQMSELIAPDILADELEEWIMESPMLKRSFRHVATVSGLTEQRHAGTRKTLRQVTFSTDLIYDVLRRYDPEHILLKVARRDAERELLDLNRLADLLQHFAGREQFVILKRPSPLAIPTVLDVRSEAVNGSAEESLLQQASAQAQAEQMMEELYVEFGD